MANKLSFDSYYFSPNNILPTQTKCILYSTTFTPEHLSELLSLDTKIALLSTWHVFEYRCVLIASEQLAIIQQWAAQLGIDFAKLETYPTLFSQGLLVMDMDSTAIQIECIDEIAKLANVGEQVSAITEQAMRGELDFEQSLRQRVQALKGQSEQLLEQVRQQLPLTSGLTRLVKTLQQKGWRIAIASGGFTYFTEDLKQRLQLDFTVANELDIVDGVLTGELKGQIVDAQYKADTLLSLAQDYNIPLTQTIAIGDGANDLPMLHRASLGIAFHAKPKVQQQVETVVNFADLTALLCILTAVEH
ncbi:phosphoserine phosphatase SerB [Mergibacter septicus]|uniref:Phosphoserine phosphatase n=1 Tax=Mergibacter septicus TaxID=221402 RepID=A0A8E3S910_9PAST|nr:phosphoserine phosphatase [Mergibacter septicus]AWX15809.1 phosphoserine phosphatase SerB [Mergibacter septicus]QDJ15062.1 phosphoserine phosphatase SerB [Mergibacter septicus]UTU47514.1 phosphoserine phosphatase [Mergibacter septicus]WMR95306.1 phosphoserine phosphatase [Mergibacter septicus]